MLGAPASTRVGASATDDRRPRYASRSPGIPFPRSTRPTEQVFAGNLEPRPEAPGLHRRRLHPHAYHARPGVPRESSVDEVELLGRVDQQRAGTLEHLGVGVEGQRLVLVRRRDEKGAVGHQGHRPGRGHVEGGEGDEAVVLSAALLQMTPESREQGPLQRHPGLLLVAVERAPEDPARERVQLRHRPWPRIRETQDGHPVHPGLSGRQRVGPGEVVDGAAGQHPDVPAWEEPRHHLRGVRLGASGDSGAVALHHDAHPGTAPRRAPGPPWPLDAHALQRDREPFLGPLRPRRLEPSPLPSQHPRSGRAVRPSRTATSARSANRFSSNARPAPPSVSGTAPTAYASTGSSRPSPRAARRTSPRPRAWRRGPSRCGRPPHARRDSPTRAASPLACALPPMPGARGPGPPRRRRLAGHRGGCEAPPGGARAGPRGGPRASPDPRSPG